MVDKEKIAEMLNLDYNNITGQYTVKIEDMIKLSMGYYIQAVNVNFNGLEY